MQALAGIVVLDLSSFVAGPTCAQMLSDFGAEVIKMEDRRGDEMRQWPPVIDGESTNFIAANRGKRSVTLNLKSEAGRDLLYKLVEKADVLIHSFLPAVAARLGLEWETLQARNPRLILCSLSGYGDRGPLSNKPGFDLMVQAFSGVMDLTGDPDGPPKRAGISTIDISTGLLAYIGISTALFARQAGKCEGQHVRVSLLETSMALLGYHITNYLDGARRPRREGSGVGHLVPYQAFLARDGYVLAGATNDDVWKRFGSALGRPDLGIDTRFALAADRVTNRAALIAAIEPVFLTKSVREWVAIFEEHKVPAAPVQSVEQLVLEPQVAAMDMLIPMDSVTGKQVQLVGIPVKLSGTPGVPKRRSPGLGEHTDEVLSELLHLSATELEQLRKEGAI